MRSFFYDDAQRHRFLCAEVSKLYLYYYLFLIAACDADSKIDLSLLFFHYGTLLMFLINKLDVIIEQYLHLNYYLLKYLHYL